jgi:ribonuclease P protein component
MTSVGRIGDRATFRALERPFGRSGRGPVRAAFTPLSPGTGALAQLAYAIGRRHGNAVHRNRLRRRLRSAVREVARDVVPGSYLLRPTPAVATMPFDDLVAAVRTAMTSAAGRPVETTTTGAPGNGPDR